MIIYNYYSETGEYLGQSEADRDPLNPDEFVIPNAATTIEPPLMIDGFARVFKDGGWTQVEDHRGEVWWDPAGFEVFIILLGNPEELGLSNSAPEAAPPALADYKSAVMLHMESKAVERDYFGVLSILSYYHSSNEVWAAEARAFNEWRDAVLEYAYAELTKLETSQRNQPSVQDFILELPVIVWP